MNIQAILDAMALIAGGAVTGRPGVYQGAGGIAGVRIAYSLLPEAHNLNEDGPVHVAFWDGMVVDPSGISAGDLTVYRHRIRVQLMLALGRSELPKAYSILTSFVNLYRNAFASNLTLKGTCSASGMESSPGIIDAIYPNRIALELIFFAVEKEAVTYAA